MKPTCSLLKYLGSVEERRYSRTLVKDGKALYSGHHNRYKNHHNGIFSQIEKGLSCEYSMVKWELIAKEGGGEEWWSMDGKLLIENNRGKESSG